MTKAQKIEAARTEFSGMLNGFELFAPDYRLREQQKEKNWCCCHDDAQPIDARLTAAIVIVAQWHARDVLHHFLNRQRPTLVKYIAANADLFPADVRQALMDSKKVEGVLVNVY